MPGPLLATQLTVPAWRRGPVPRARLSNRLDGPGYAKLTLVAAPAGFGRTTLLADWLAAVPRHCITVAWLSVDQSDDDPASFWTYLITALQTVAPEVGADALALLQSTRPAPFEAVLATLLNEFGAIRSDVVLVLEIFQPDGGLANPAVLAPAVLAPALIGKLAPTASRLSKGIRSPVRQRFVEHPFF